MVCCCRPIDALEAMKQVLAILSAVAMVGASVASFSAGHALKMARSRPGILGALAGTILGVATAPRSYYAPAPIYVEPTPVYVELRCFWMPGELIWDGWPGA